MAPYTYPSGFLNIVPYNGVSIYFCLAKQILAIQIQIPRKTSHWAPLAPKPEPDREVRGLECRGAGGAASRWRGPTGAAPGIGEPAPRLELDTEGFGSVFLSFCREPPKRAVRFASLFLPLKPIQKERPSSGYLSHSPAMVGKICGLGS